MYLGSGFPAPSLVPTSPQPQKKVTETFPEKLASNIRPDKPLANTGPWTNGVWEGGVADSVPGQDGAAMGVSAQSETRGGGGQGEIRGGVGRGVGLVGPKQSVPPHGVPDPVHVSAHFGVDPRLGGCVARDITPGHNALQDASTDQGSPGVPLRGEREAGARSFGSSVPSPILTTIHHRNQDPTPPHLNSVAPR